MPSTPVIPCILPHEFTAFAALLSGDDEFPGTYASWLQLAYRDNQHARVTAVDIHPHEFADYCKHQQKEPSMRALHAFAKTKVPVT